MSSLGLIGLAIYRPLTASLFMTNATILSSSIGSHCWIETYSIGSQPSGAARHEKSAHVVLATIKVERVALPAERWDRSKERAMNDRDLRVEVEKTTVGSLRSREGPHARATCRGKAKYPKIHHNSFPSTGPPTSTKEPVQNADRTIDRLAWLSYSKSFGTW
jgi:hypothetical protein